MPAGAGSGTGDVASTACTESGGASGAAFQSAETPKSRGVRVDGRFEPTPLEDGDPFGRRVAAGTRSLDFIGVGRLPQFFDELADQAGALDAYFEVCIIRGHA